MDTKMPLIVFLVEIGIQSGGSGGKEPIFSEKYFYKKITEWLRLYSIILSGKTGSFQITVLDRLFEYLWGGNGTGK